MTIDELMAEAEKYNFGDGVSANKEKAAYYYEQAAEAGDTVAQYNIGLMYFKGDGVPLSNEKAVYWFEKAAAQDDPDAKDMLASFESMDVAQRAVVAHQNLKAYAPIMLEGSSGAEEAFQEYQRALELSNAIIRPNEDDQKVRRDIYRYLGFTKYLSGTPEEAYAYFKLGQPVSESNDEKILYCYLEMLNKLRVGNASKFGETFYSAIEDIYKNAYSKITDMDYKAPVIKWAIQGWCGNFCAHRDIAAAEKAKVSLLTYAQKQERGELQCMDNLREMYNYAFKLVSEAKKKFSSSEMSSYSSSTSSNSTPKKQKGFLSKLLGL